MAIEVHASMSVHPGPWLKRNVTEHYHLNVTEAARHLKVTRAAMSNLLNGKAGLSPEMAIRFQKGFGIPASTLLRMQSAFDLAQAEKAADSIDVERIPEPA